MMLSVKTVALGVHCWLPDAMEGPTAVSAIIHAATLVVAGVLLMVQVSYTSNRLVCPSCGLFKALQGAPKEYLAQAWSG